LKIERIVYREWPEAYRCAAGPLELVVVATVGPRILSLSFQGGDNLLYEDATDFRVESWRLYGGHRLSIAPESEASYAPDNAPCDVESSANRLRLHTPVLDGLIRGLEIRPAGSLSPVGRAGLFSSPPEFVLRHFLRNVGPTCRCIAPWAITCVPPEGQVVVPEPTQPPRFWSPPDRRYADAASPQWRDADDHFLVAPNGARGKVGLAAPRGWLALLRSDTTLVVSGPKRIAGGAYPDGGCNVEVFTCADYLELETLGELITLPPGDEVIHEQHWQVIPQGFAPAAWRSIARRMRKHPRATPDRKLPRHAQQVHVASS